MRPLVMASASTVRKAASTVRILPCVTIVSAACCAAAPATRIATRAEQAIERVRIDGILSPGDMIEDMASSRQPARRSLGGGGHPADSHDLIRVQGARVNNLKDVSVEFPKRRLTVFTGVSGSGKSSLVFGTIAAESQRLINETYSAFVQGFMPTLARPDVDVLEGLTTAIIVDQERMGANSRSTVGTVTDANAMLRVLFSRIAKPHIGSSNAFSFNIPSIRAAGSMTLDKGAARAQKVVFTRTGGMW